MLKIDLGSGGCKQEGFLGVDRFPLENVDIVADLDGRLPFDSNSVDLVYASHSLEHVHDLMATMREIYRVCKHGAQICIVAPYNEQKLNLANPYHICVFNEHTPRFWTDYPEAFIDPEEYAHPHAPHWGLSKSDHSNPGLDLRLVGMEFFYFPDYRHLSVGEQRALRKERMDVCDQVMYHLIVWKGDDSSPDRTFADHVATFIPFEPNYVLQRKSMERDELLQYRIQERDDARREADHLREQISELRHLLAQSETDARRGVDLEADVDRIRALLQDARSENHQLRMQVSGLFEKIELLNDQVIEARVGISRYQIESGTQAELMVNLKQEVQLLQSHVSILINQLECAQESLSETQAEASEARASLTSLMQENHVLRSSLEGEEVLRARKQLIKTELAATNGLLDWYRAKEASWNEEIANIKSRKRILLQEKSNLEGSWAGVKNLVIELYSQLNVARTSKLGRIFSFFSKKDDLWDLVSPMFFEIKQYTAEHFRHGSRNRLILGGDIGNVPYREYVIPYDLHSLTSIALAIRPLMPASQGSVGVEVVTSAKHVVAHMSMPLLNINPDMPTVFTLPTPFSNLGKGWWLRVFVRDADVPVAVYELIGYSGLSRRVNFMPFVSLH